ncbi:MAG: response regulator [Lachnospiraceae bacterium]|nr:response regulator [Lachnospiraceae bacterium]
MLIFVIDDEISVLEDTKETISKVVADAKIITFMRAADALDMIEKGEKPDVVFSDIEMPGISGLDFSIRLKNISPDTRIIFVTGYEKYAVEAFKTRACGYLLKPLDAVDVKEELDYIIEESTGKQSNRIVASCFGHFDLYWNGEPLIFSRRKSKELLAYLIYRNGAACSSGEIGLALWEETDDAKAEQNRIRVLINDIKGTLKELGIENLLIREHRQLAIKKEMIECDYYKMLEGDMNVMNSYNGKFMEDYHWADLSRVHFNKSK